ncbi:MAG: hypothetical protein AAF489_12775 [Bacteroidota bacterium]
MTPEEKKKYYEEVSKFPAANASEWLGAIFRYGLNFGKRKFSTFFTPEEYRKNAIIGNLLKFVILISIIGVGLWFYA